jgi:hypothetical protein
VNVPLVPPGDELELGTMDMEELLAIALDEDGSLQ